MKLALAVAGGALLALTLACGEAEAPTVTLTFQPEIPTMTPAISTGAVLDATVGTLRKRADLYGLGTPEISVGAGNTITVTVKGTDQETAAELLGRQAVLEFKKPTLTVEGIVACQAADGEVFGVLPENVNPDAASRSPARCFSRDKVGDPMWEPAAAGDSELTAESVEENGWEPRQDGLVATFTQEGSMTLEALTKDLVGYRLGMFVDGGLVAAPKIERAITGGQVGITGFGANDSRVRAAQLNSGPLPVKLVLLSSASPAP